MFLNDRRVRILLFLCFLLAFYIAVKGSLAALASNTNDVKDWIPSDFVETKLLEEYVRHFGRDDFLMISWPQCELDDPRLSQLATKLRTLSPGFTHVTTGLEALERLTSEPLELSQNKAVARLKGLMIGDDGVSTCIVVASSSAESKDRAALINSIYDSVDSIDGLSRTEVKIAGIMIDGVAIDEASQENLLFLTLLCSVICCLVMLISFRNFALSAIVFVVASMNSQIGNALIHYTGWHMDSILLMVPSLVFVLSISAGVHLVNYYRDAAIEHGPDGAAGRMVSAGWLPCTLAAATTAIGLLSLLASYLVPIQKFGLYAALGLLLGTGVLFLMMPCFIIQFPQRKYLQRVQAASQRKGNGNSWSWMSNLVTRFPYLLLVISVFITAVSAWGLSKITSSVSIHDMLPAEAKVLQDYHWLEGKIGPLVPIEVVVEIPASIDKPEAYEVPQTERMRLVRAVEGSMRRVDGIGATVSAVTFAPDLPRGALSGFQLRERLLRTALEKHLTKSRPTLIEMGYLDEAKLRDVSPTEAESLPLGRQFWRVTGFVDSGRRLNYQTVVNDLQTQLAPLTERAQAKFPDVSIWVTGGVPLVRKAQNQLLRDLVTSFGFACVLIALAMVVLMTLMSWDDFLTAKNLQQRIAWFAKAAVAGIISMIPNVMPCIVVFGAMGLLAIDVDVGTVMTATAAMGIAVDDTLHYITWFRRGMVEGLSPAAATRHAYQKCGTAMLQTTVICGLGLLIYGYSPFRPIGRFAYLMFSMLSAALLADLILLPALLNSVMGRAFWPRIEPLDETDPKKPTTAAARQEHAD
jgi:predicted RND superfamily exporter protein